MKNGTTVAIHDVSPHYRKDETNDVALPPEKEGQPREVLLHAKDGGHAPQTTRQIYSLAVFRHIFGVEHLVAAEKTLRLGHELMPCL